jgi:hypothetical protein
LNDFPGEWGRLVEDVLRVTVVLIPPTSEREGDLLFRIADAALQTLMVEIALL